VLTAVRQAASIPQKRYLHAQAARLEHECQLFEF